MATVAHIVDAIYAGRTDGQSLLRRDSDGFLWRWDSSAWEEFGAANVAHYGSAAAIEETSAATYTASIPAAALIGSGVKAYLYFHAGDLTTMQVKADPDGGDDLWYAWESVAAASLGAPSSGRTWRVLPEFRPVAGNVLSALPGDDEIYGLNLDLVLPAGAVLTAATLTVDADDDAEALTVGTPQVNAEAFTDLTGGTCPIGRGVLFRLAGGSVGGALPNYRITVDVEWADGSAAFLCRLRVSEDL